MDDRNERLLLRLQQFFETKAPACQQSECPNSHSMQFLLSTHARIRIQTKKTSPLQSLLCQSQPPARPTYEHSRRCTSSFAACAGRGCPKKLVCADVHVVEGARRCRPCGDTTSRSTRAELHLREEAAEEPEHVRPAAAPELDCQALAPALAYRVHVATAGRSGCSGSRTAPSRCP